VVRFCCLLMCMAQSHVSVISVPSTTQLIEEEEITCGLTLKPATMNE
jgi:hypothetical protein